MTATRRIRDVLFSDRGMKVVNILFWLAFLSYGIAPVIGLMASFAWVAYLAYGIKTASSKFVKIAFSLFMALALLSVALNGYSILYILSN